MFEWEMDGLRSRRLETEVNQIAAEAGITNLGLANRSDGLVRLAGVKCMASL